MELTFERPQHSSQDGHEMVYRHLTSKDKGIAFGGYIGPRHCEKTGLVCILANMTGLELGVST